MLYLNSLNHSYLVLYLSKTRVKIIILLYKRPLDSYGLKSCEQNDSRQQRAW